MKKVERFSPAAQAAHFAKTNPEKPKQETTVPDKAVKEIKVKKEDKPLEAIVYKEFDFHWTKDYNMFNRIKSNRPIMEKHVKNIVEAIKLRNLLHLVPIICDATYNVLDGQHRLESAKRLKIPIYYVVDETITKADIALLNTNKQNWKIIDYITFFAAEGNTEYEKLLTIMQENRKLTPVNTVLLLATNDRHANSKFIKSGTITFNNYKQGVKTIQMLSDWFNYFEFAYDRWFLLALRKAVDFGKYDHAFLMARIDKYKYLAKRQFTQGEYQDMISKIYNTDSKKVVKLFSNE